MFLKSDLCAFHYTQRETRKAELEANIATNLKRRITELKATIASIDDDSLPSSAGIKEQELDDAKLLVNEAAKELKSGSQTF